MTVVVRSAVTGPDSIYSYGPQSSRILLCQHAEVPCHR